MTVASHSVSDASISQPLNIADRLRDAARLYAFQRAVVFPAGRDASGRVTYSQMTFAQLHEESDRLAAGLQKMGVAKGTRIVLMVRPSLEFITLTFALFKTGAVIVLIDPGMGRSNIFQCLAEVEPEGFVALPMVQAIRTVYSRRFLQAKLNVTVGGRRWFWGGPTYQDLVSAKREEFQPVITKGHDSAAIIFTSGSTGPPKGVLYEHAMFDAQVKLLRDFYSIEPGEVDLPGFPLFALFNTAMGVTTVIPDMDPTKPAQVDPQKIIEAIRDQGVTQAFGSPAIWNRVGRYCEQHKIVLPSLKRVLSAGAPVPVHVTERMRQTFQATNADIHTPYGATESLPVASICGKYVLERTAARSREGWGTCVGKTFPQIQLKIIDITDGPIEKYADVTPLASGEIGEIIVQGPVVTREYFRKPEATANAKIPDGEQFWHRMGDVGYLDSNGELWFCGRKAHIVDTQEGRMYSVPCEAIFNEHPLVFRCALVGIGEKPHQRPVIVVELEKDAPAVDKPQLFAELRELASANPITNAIDTFLIHPALPVDIRHNVKIFREKLVPWAAAQLRDVGARP